MNFEDYKNDQSPEHFFAATLGFAGGIYGLYHAYKTKGSIVSYFTYFTAFAMFGIFSGLVVDVIVPPLKPQ